KGDASEEHDRANVCGRQMGEIGVADQWVDADSGNETGAAGERDRLPEMARGLSAPNAEEKNQTARRDAAPKPSAIVGDQRNESGIHGGEIMGRHANEAKILRDKDVGHA